MKDHIEAALDAIDIEISPIYRVDRNAEGLINLINLNSRPGRFIPIDEPAEGGPTE